MGRLLTPSISHASSLSDQFSLVTFGEKTDEKKTTPPNVSPREEKKPNLLFDGLKLGIVVGSLALIGPFVGLSIASMLSLPALIFGLAIPAVIDLFTQKKTGPLAALHKLAVKTYAKGIVFVAKRKWIIRWIKKNDETAETWATRQVQKLHLERLKDQAKFESTRRGGVGGFTWNRFKNAFKNTGETGLRMLGIGLLNGSHFMFKSLRQANSLSMFKQPLDLFRKGQIGPAIAMFSKRGFKSLITFRFWKSIMIGTLLGGIGEVLTRVLLAALYKKPPVIPTA